jgi:hypothetical protein
MFSVGRGGAGGGRSSSPEDSQTATMLNERSTIQTEYEQQVKKHHVESNPNVCPSNVMSRNIDASQIYCTSSILLEEAVLATYQSFS